MCVTAKKDLFAIFTKKICIEYCFATRIIRLNLRTKHSFQRYTYVDIVESQN